MESVQVFHNPQCSKSRGALEILTERGVSADVVEYLHAPPDRATLERIIDAIPDEPAALVRHDKRFGELGLDADGYTSRGAVVGLLLEHPELMERPVVFVGERAVIARPSEKVLELLASPEK
ncbi:MAG: arsenate reductase [Acidimicrobiia bacterium]|jgi:arsenate reductase|nr:arsenate reductase [Acidimicrobiia bacterium]